VRIGRALLAAAVVGAVSYAAYRAVQHFAPQGVDAFARQVREGMAEREAQLREALGAEAGLDDDATHTARHGSAMTAQEARDLIDDPAGLSPGRRSVPPHAPQARAGRGS
jgi:hypothetical protein